MTVINAIKTISGKPLAIASKALGIATCAAVIYDSHINAKEQAYVTDNVETGDRLYSQYKQYISCDKQSASISKMKKLWFDMQQKFPFYHAASKSKGYLGGLGKNLLEDIPLIGLSAVAIKCKKVGKVAGVLLGVNAIKTICYDVLGIGNKNK